MKLTLIQPTDVPGPLRDRFGVYYLMFERMFANQGFSFEAIKLSDGQPLPDPATLDATLVMGSAAGVYDSHYSWMNPLRDYIRAAYAANKTKLAIDKTESFINLVKANSGTAIPNVWRSSHDLVNVAGLLRSAASTLRFSLNLKSNLLGGIL